MDIDEEYIRKKSQHIKDSDIQKAVNNSDKIQDKFNKSSILSRFLEDAKLLLCMLKDYCTGEYREFPFCVIAAVCFTLLYVLNPIDIIPDVFPVVGQLDDAAVVTLCLVLIEQEFQAYKAWKLNQKC